MAQFSQYDFFSANPGMGSPYEGGFNGGEAWTAFNQETGSRAGFESPEYRAWAMSKIAPNTLEGFRNSKNGVRLLPNGMMDVDEKILASGGMKGDGMLGGFDLFGGDGLFAPGMLIAGPFAGMMGAFGGAAGAGAGLGVGESVSGFYGPAAGELGGYAASYGAGLGDAAWGASTPGGDAWFQNLMENYNPDLGFQGYEAPSTSGFQMPAAVPETPAQLTEWGLKEVSPGVWSMPDIPSSASSAADWLSKIAKDPQTWGKLIATGLGVVGSNQQTKALQTLSSNFAEYGAPYRARLAASYADPAGFLANSPDIKAAVDQGTSATARALSVQGNPAGSGHALQELQSYATNGLYGKLGQERDRLAGFGGLTAYNQAAPQAAANAVNSEGGVLNAIGAGINSIMSPQKTTFQTMMDYFNTPGVA